MINVCQKVYQRIFYHLDRKLQLRIVLMIKPLGKV